MYKKIFTITFVTLLCLEGVLHVIGWGTKFFTLNDDTIEKSLSKTAYKIMVLGESTSYGFLLENREKDAYPY